MDRAALILTVTGEFAGDEESSYRPSSAGNKIEAYLVRRVLSVPWKFGVLFVNEESAWTELSLRLRLLSGVRSPGWKLLELM
jgi:hypothetical protein